MNRETLLQWVSEQYGTTPDFPFENDNYSAVLRHPCGKWYGLVFSVPTRTFGGNDGYVDAVNLKCDPALADLIRDEPYIAPAYHMNKKHWISVLLDGSAPDDRVKFLVDHSFGLVTPKSKRNHND